MAIASILKVGAGMATRGKRVNGTLHSDLEVQNGAVLTGLYESLLPNGVKEAGGLKPVHPALRGLGEEDRRTVELATEQMKKVIKSPHISVEKDIQQFSIEQWEVNGDNMEEEFREVERRTFSDDINWGRIIAFLAFSISFASYVSSRGISGGAGSVFAWTNQALNTTLIEFIRKEDGWVS